MTKFDKTAEYKKSIEPIVKQLKLVCNEHHIPFFISFGVKLSPAGKFERGDGLKSQAILPEVYELNCNDRIFAEFVNVVNGFSPSRAKPETFDID